MSEICQRCGFRKNEKHGDGCLIADLRAKLAEAEKSCVGATHAAMKAEGDIASLSAKWERERDSLRADVERWKALRSCQARGQSGVCGWEPLAREHWKALKSREEEVRRLKAQLRIASKMAACRSGGP